MKKAPKLFDTYQKIILGFFIAFEVTRIFYFIREELFLLPHYEEVLEGTIEVPLELSIPYTAFTFLSLAAFVWFVIRLITYSKRKRDYLLEQN